MSKERKNRQVSYTARSRQRRIRRRIMMGLAVFVMVSTVYALMLPAITLEMKCGLLEHVHEPGCYTQITSQQITVMSCETEHVHTEACYLTAEEPVDSQKLNCEIPEDENHTHTPLCDGIWELTCGIPEHVHPLECEPAATEPTEKMQAEINPTEVLPTEMALFLSETTALEATDPVPDAGAQDGDLPLVSGDGIKFRLFNYSTNINKAAGNSSWRSISNYFTFRDSTMTAGTDPASVNIPSPNMNTAHDEDGFTAHHATVERVLDGNGNPVLDLTRNADGTMRTNPGLSAEVRSLAYLFSDTGDHAVTAYSLSNTILQKSGTHYWYKSNSNAVDFDASANLFRVRSYTERNSTTAGYGSSYGDFLPFTFTGGKVLGTNANGASYHVLNSDTDYWFGMTMEVNFFQTRGGVLGGENMVFSFSGDDDVWVFVDDVLVLDLGGTHGTVDGSINFATGEVLQYLSWNGANTTEKARTEGSDTSFPTTIRACFDAAGKTPIGGWSADGQTFADYTEHTLKFFYLERGAAVANCILDFALPTLPDKSLTVTKDLVAEGGEVTDYIRDSLSYQFRVVKADEGGDPTNELFIKPGMTYALLENGVKISTETVDANGFFHLKAGQSAQFTEMLRKGDGAAQYIVEEILPDSLTGQYAGVEYEVSGAGGDTRTGEGPAQGFSAFRTDVLSAEETQTVTYRNKVDTTKLGTLQITKRMAAGSRFQSGQIFHIQVKLGDALLPVGTEYAVGEEKRTISEAGIMELRIDETATILKGILSGTTYEVTELDTAEGSFNASYSGSVSPGGTVNCTADGVSGEFPLGSTVHITVTNASYDFSLQIPITKRAIDNTETATFYFLAEQVEPETWEVTNSLPGTSIAVSDDSPVDGRVVIGFDAGTEGTFWYRIREQKGSGSYIYDDTFYILEVTVKDGAAQVVNILKNGTDPAAALIFENRKTTSLIVTKTVTGGTGTMKFPFTAAVTLNGDPFPLPDPGENSGYRVSGNLISFSLAHGETICIPHLPIGAEVSVTETQHNGFIAFYQVAGVHNTPVQGNWAALTTGHTVKTLNFTNESGYQLPDTGGTGTLLYATGGMALTAVVSLLLLYSHTKGRKEEKASS